MNTRLVSIILLVLLIVGCSRHVSDEYFHNFYQTRQNKLVHLIDGERAPLTAQDLKHIAYYPYQNSHRVSAKFIKSEEIKIIEMATYSGEIKEFAKIGKLIFSLENKSNEIHVYQNVRYANHPIYGQDYFIPFKDLTSGHETYGGGRYIDIKKSLFDSNRVLLDFNQVYNPWCAYADGYNCPIPPTENNLQVSIRAGEKLFKKTKQH